MQKRKPGKSNLACELHRKISRLLGRAAELHFSQAVDVFIIGAA